MGRCSNSQASPRSRARPTSCAAAAGFDQRRDAHRRHRGLESLMRPGHRRVDVARPRDVRRSPRAVLVLPLQAETRRPRRIDRSISSAVGGWMAFGAGPISAAAGGAAGGSSSAQAGEAENGQQHYPSDTACLGLYPSSLSFTGSITTWSPSLNPLTISTCLSVFRPMVTGRSFVLPSFSSTCTECFWSSNSSVISGFGAHGDRAAVQIRDELHLAGHAGHQQLGPSRRAQPSAGRRSCRGRSGMSLTLSIVTGRFKSG